ncbi:hypothetical protein RN001_010375 [Aquatica leii]|uniref:Gustatory receptor n=1 Tax=Aquatica leii TaxID=1421715 RepID=A0AAN7P6D2_9COLE|nr:hypothetical protein RN001_010375 [Aquatica leii]
MKWITRVLFKRKVKNEDLRFYKSIGFIILLGQAFGIMPLRGVTGATERSIYFTWKSWRVLYTVFILAGTLFCVYASLMAAIQQDDNMSLITASIFYGTSFVVHILFVLLAKNWSQLMRKWCAVDVSMRSYGYPPHLDARLKILSGIVLTCATAEHIIVVTKNMITAHSCLSVEFFEYYFARISYPQVFAIVRYSFWFGLIMQIITTASTFSWTYIDLFIILLSTSLAVRFKQVAKRVETYVNSKVLVSDIVLWRNVREDYNRLGKLCKALNDALSYIVLLSFGSNLFFILVQFFHSLRPIGGTFNKIYFFYSFGFLIGRTICVSLYGAWIHDESQKPLPLLNSVSSSVYNVEIRRFILHVGIETISLTGKRFFNVTRSIILSIAGTIVTYELVLIQFYGFQIQTASEGNSSCSVRIQYS